MSELRRDPIVDRWVVMDSTRRFDKEEARKAYPKDNSHCPFCHGNEYMTKPELLAYSNNYSRQPNSDGWHLRVVPNNNPMLRTDIVLKKAADGIYDKMDGVGAHEIIIESAEHFLKMQDTTVKYYENVFSALIARIRDLKNDIRLEYILFLKKYGLAAGAVIEHPYSQLIAMPVVPKKIKDELSECLKYFNYKERCVFCDIILQELSQKVRVITENESFIAISPYASVHPFEIWILPKNHNSDFDSISPQEVSALSQISHFVFLKLNTLLEDCPHSFTIHTAPLKQRNLAHYHWHIEIVPKLSQDTGFEWATGLYTNPVFPEEATKYLIGENK